MKIKGSIKDVFGLFLFLDEMVGWDVESLIVKLNFLVFQFSIRLSFIFNYNTNLSFWSKYIIYPNYQADINFTSIDMLRLCSLEG